MFLEIYLLKKHQRYQVFLTILNMVMLLCLVLLRQEEQLLLHIRYSYSIQIMSHMNLIKLMVTGENNLTMVKN